MHRQIVLGIVLSVILISGVAAGALAQEGKFSARVLAKGSKSNVFILVKNSSKSTESIYEFTVTFTKGKPSSAIARGGWDDQRDGNTVTFTTKKSPVRPGGTTVFLIKVSDPAASAFEWSISGRDDTELQSGEVPKIKVREKKPVTEKPKVTGPEINVNPVRINQGGQVVVSGKGFSPATSVQIFLDDQQQLTTSTTNAVGEFSAVIIIPSGTGAGAHKITAKDSLGKSSLIQILVEGAGGETAPPQGQLILTVRTDKDEYNPGEAVKITGTAVLESPVSLQVFDSQGFTICGANPQVNNATMTWESICFLPNSAPGGVYTIQAKQIVHKTGVKFTVKSPIAGGSSGGPGPGGENPGSLKLSSDKANYKSGETVKITLEGARAKSIARITVVGPAGPPLETKMITTDETGKFIYTFPLVGADPGIYKVSATQDKFIVRMTFEVVAS